MKDKAKAYLETSIWSRLVDHEDPDRRRLTRAFMARGSRKLRWYSSDVVTAEVHLTRDPDVRRQIARHIDMHRPRTITRSTLADRIMEDLIARGIGTPTRVADMFHLALAITGQAAYLVSWDQGHLSNERIDRLVRAFCGERGYNELRIGTPIQVAEWSGIGLR